MSVQTWLRLQVSRVVTWRGAHADEAARVAETAATVSLVRRSRVVVERKVSFASCSVDTDCVARQCLAVTTLAYL